MHMKKYIFAFLICLFTSNGIGHIHGETSSPIEDHSVVNQRAPEKNPSLLPPAEELDSFFNKPEREDDYHTKFTNMLGILALLISFMILASWAIKRMMKTRISQLNTQSSIKVLETRYLSPKSTIYLLDVMGQAILVGESSAGLHPLSKVQLKQFEEIEETESENLQKKER
jgi:flagellar biogenesis protein FliO